MDGFHHHLNFLGMIACYVCYRIEIILWQDWAIIISAVGFFIFYIISLRGSGFQIVHKYLRTFLLLVPTILVLYITCHTIHLALLEYSDMKERRGFSDSLQFTCRRIGNYICYLRNTNLFMALMTALFCG
ncbi:MAG: hypothetical protein JOS17DRAFT_729390, partial [Linnemannia elongata]